MRVDRAERSLLRRRGLLKEPEDAAALLAAIDPVVLRHVGADEGADAGDPLFREDDGRGIEVEEHVARGDDDLPASRLRPGQLEISRDEPVEKRRAQRAARSSRDGHEDLAARPVWRQAPGVPSGVDDQDPEPPEDAGPGSRIETRSASMSGAHLEVEHAQETMDRGAARPDAPAAGIGDDEDPSDSVDESE